MNFSEMRYERPDIELSAAFAEQLKLKFQNAVTFSEADAALMQWDDFTAHIDTMINLAYVRLFLVAYRQFYVVLACRGM